MNSQLGQCGILAESPAGIDPRQGETFAALQSEMDRLTDINAPGEPDWKKVARLAEDILAKEGKDLAVACWLLASWYRQHRLPGLVTGVEVLRDLHQTYWDDMFPSRLRGRRNQMAWLVEWLSRSLDLIDETEPPLEPESHARLVAAWGEVDAVWRERDEDGPSFAQIRSRFQSLPVIDDAEPEPEPVAEEPVAAVAPARSVTARQLPAAPVAPVAMPAAPDLATLQTPQALEQALERMLAVVQPLLLEALARSPGLAWPYRLNRSHAWATIDVVPPATAGQTRVPGPSQQDRDILERLVQQSDASALLQFAESSLPRCRFWLDLNYHSWRALSALPDGRDAAAAVAADTAAFVARLPGLDTLSFADEQPFAAAACRQWLAGLATSPSTSGPPTEFRGTPGDTLALATAIAAASAQTESAHSLLAAALERLRESAQQVAHRVVAA